MIDQVNLSTKCLKTTLSNSIGGWAPQASGWGIFRSSTKTFYRFTQSFLVVTRFRSNRVYLSSGECPSVNPSYTSFSNGRSINSFSSSVHFHHDTILCLFRSCSRRIINDQWDVANSFCSRTCFQKPCICYCRFTSTYSEINGPSLADCQDNLVKWSRACWSNK